ncbi:hypothetical protein CHS0354_025347 [Potamilus streckersoni]|uniref:E3 ubiquitin-protein ligase RNF34 n=1 Tax=Potamilus streckersoni TaxID=2493646 RepID=A0AAE0VZN3_9BIVA|nr:hypothetical protein CHS0354_025347 [Potamilus streckersoni]
MGAGTARMSGGLSGDTPVTIHIHAGHGNIPTFTTGNNIGSCEGCSLAFTSFRKKKICKDCERDFCSSCMIQQQSYPGDLNSLWQCKMCQTLISGTFTRSELMNWKNKDLKALLQKRKIDISACREKEDLIDAVFATFGGNNQNGSQSSRNSQSTATPTSSSQLGGQNNRQTDPSGTRQSNEQQQQQHEQHRLNDQQREQQQQHARMAGELLLEVLRQEAAENSQRDNEKNDNSQETDAQIITVPITLDDIKSEKEIDDLSIKQLKKLLLSNFVDYKGCCERWELEQRVRRLWKEDQINKQKAEEVRKAEENPQKTSSVSASVTGNEDDICKICMDAVIDCVLLECGHMVTCTSCGKQLAECPMCRQYVSRAVHIFKS